MKSGSLDHNAQGCCGMNKTGRLFVNVNHNWVPQQQPVKFGASNSDVKQNQCSGWPIDVYLLEFFRKHNDSEFARFPMTAESKISTMNINVHNMFKELISAYTSVSNSPTKTFVKSTNTNVTWYVLLVCAADGAMLSLEQWWRDSSHWLDSH